MRRLAVLALLIPFVGSAEARPLKGSGPTTIAVGYGAAWVGFGDGIVTRVDARTLRLLPRRLASRTTGYIMSIATGFGSVWVAAGGAALQRLDPRTGTVRVRIGNQPGSWSGSATQIATGAGSVWIADHERNAILRVSVRGNRVDRRRSLPHRLLSITGGPSGVWVTTVPGLGPVTGSRGPRIVSRLDPRTLRLRRAFRLTCDANLQADRDSLWVLDNCDGSLRRFDPKAGRLSGPTVSPGALGLSAGFGSIWVSDGSTVRRVEDGRVIAAIPVRGLAAAGEGVVWVLDMGNGVAGRLRRIDPATNRLVGRPIRLPSR